MLKELSSLRTMVDDLNSTNSTNDKKTILSKYKNDEFLKKVLFYTYNPFYQFYVTPTNCEKYYNDDLGNSVKVKNLFELLDALRHRKITGHTAVQTVNNFVYEFESYKDLIYKILGKDLEVRMGDSLINKVIPGLIPTFDVALATDIEDVDVDFNDDVWFSSRKLDGVRCAIIIGDDLNDIAAWSRQGNEFTTLQVILDEVKKLGLKNVILDGEICLVDKEGNEDFQGIMKQIRKKEHTIQNPKYLLFDLIPLSEFENKKGKTLYSARYESLRKTIPAGNKYLTVIEQTKLHNEEHFTSLMNEADHNGWEGLILRKNVGYEGKRSKNMLKSKSFKDGEYKVIDAEFGPFRMIVGGKEVTKNVLTNVIIEHKGNTVSVGSGFSIEEREYYKLHPNEIIGAEITVKYFQETKNQQGKWSLRFPTVKVIHGNKRTV